MPLSRHIFKAPTRFYKTGVVFLAYLNGLQDHFLMVGGQQSARSLVHLAELFRLADKARVLRDPELAARADAQGAGGRRHRLSSRGDAHERRGPVDQSRHRARSNGPCGEAVEACLGTASRAIAPWRDQVEAIGLDGSGAHRARQRHARHRPLPRRHVSGRRRGRARAAAIDDNRRAIDEAAALGADCLVLVVGGLPEGSRDIAAARDDGARTGIAAILPHARAAGMPLAIEPLHPMYAADRACVNTLEQALDLCDAARRRASASRSTSIMSGGTRSSTRRSRAPAPAGSILAHHICDWLVPTRDLLLDRGMMGDGVIDLRGIRAAIEAAGYHGPQEVEIFSAENWWKRPGDEVLATCVERYRTVC